MKLFAPDLHLIRRSVIGESDKYFLQVITWTDQFCYVADTNHSISTDAEEPGTLMVEIGIYLSDNLPLNTSIKPVLHDIEIGELPATNINWVQVKVFVDNSTGGANYSVVPTASSTLSTSDADEEARPIEAKKF